jgi:hypothetical protein
MRRMIGEPAGFFDLSPRCFSTTVRSCRVDRAEDMGVMREKRSSTIELIREEARKIGENSPRFVESSNLLPIFLDNRSRT